MTVESVIVIVNRTMEKRPADLLNLKRKEKQHHIINSAPIDQSRRMDPKMTILTPLFGHKLIGDITIDDRMTDPSRLDQNYFELT